MVVVESENFWMFAYISALLTPVGCGDDSASADGGASATGGSSETTSDDDDDSASTRATASNATDPASSDTTASPEPADTFGESCIDEDSLVGPRCAPVDWGFSADFDLRPSVGWSEEQVDLASCTTFAIAASAAGEATAFDVALSCALGGDRFPRAFAMRVWVPSGTPMPWRNGQHVLLSAFAIWPPPAFSVGSNRFAVRDADTQEILVGGATAELYEHNPMFAPFEFERRFDVCGQPRLSEDDSCSLPLFEGPFGIDVRGESDGAPTLLMDGTSTVIDDTTFFTRAAHMTWSCLCSDGPRWSEAVVFGTAFADDGAVDPPECNPLGSDCGPDQQCLPVRDDAGWGHTACVDTGPAGRGESCAVDTDCTAQTRCVPSASGTSICRAECSGTIDDLSCAEGEWCSIDGSNGAPPMTCLPECDPLGDDCAPGDGCYLDYATVDFRCMPLDEQPGHGEACSELGCAPGSVCYQPGLPGSCDEYCCVAVCDLDAPVCPEGLACTADVLFASDPELGVCLVP